MSSYEEEYYPRHRHSYRPRHGYRINNVSDTWEKNERLNGRAKSSSNGNGSSTALSGRNGSHAQAEGTHGSRSRTKHQNDKSSARDRWSTYEDSNGKKNQVRDNWVDCQKNDNKANGESRGKGSTKAISDDDNSVAFGKGTRGSEVKSTYKNNRRSKRDKFQNYYDGHKNFQVRDQFDHKGRVYTKGRGEGHGHSKAITQSNNRGTAVQAKGSRGSRGMTTHKGDEHSARRNWKQGKIGNRRFAVNNNTIKYNRTKGDTFSEARGKGDLKTFTNRDKGSGSHSKGTLGTKNNADYKFDGKSKAHNWSTDNWGYSEKKHHVRPHYRRYRPYTVGNNYEEKD